MKRSYIVTLVALAVAMPAMLMADAGIYTQLPSGAVLARSPYLQNRVVRFWPKKVQVSFPTSKALRSVCPSTKSLVGGQIWKSRQSPHIRDKRQSSTGFIFMRSVRSGPSCATAYDKKGNRVHSLGAYYPPGSLYSWRGYGCWGCGSCESPSRVAAKAKANTGSVEIYVKTTSNSCVKIPDPRRCYNSVGC